MPVVVGCSQDIQVGHLGDLPEQASDAKTGIPTEVGETVSDDLWKASICSGLAERHAEDRFALTRRDLWLHISVMQQDRRRNVDSSREPLHQVMTPGEVIAARQRSAHCEMSMSVASSANELASRTFPFRDTFPLTMVFRKSLTELKGLRRSAYQEWTLHAGARTCG